MTPENQQLFDGIRKTQNRHDTTIASLRDDQAAIQRRLSALEGS